MCYHEFFNSDGKMLITRYIFVCSGYLFFEVDIISINFSSSGKTS